MLLSVIRLTIFQFYWIQILATEVLLSFTRPFFPQFFHLTFGWSMALRPTKVEWRFTAKEFGERSAVRIGDINDAHVVCRMLGYASATAASCCSVYGSGVGQIWLRNVSCNGNEASLVDCPQWGMGWRHLSSRPGCKCCLFNREAKHHFYYAVSTYNCSQHKSAITEYVRYFCYCQLRR